MDVPRKEVRLSFIKYLGLGFSVMRLLLIIHLVSPSDHSGDVFMNDPSDRTFGNICPASDPFSLDGNGSSGCISNVFYHDFTRYTHFLSLPVSLSNHCSRSISFQHIDHIHSRSLPHIFSSHILFHRCSDDYPLCC